MRDWGLDTAGVQIDGTRPTGTVRVSMDSGQPRYEIPPDQAYDFIDADQVISAVAGEEFSLLHHGTLALRSPASRESLVWLTRRLDVNIFLDPTLRPPWWEMQAVRDAMQRATWAKLNREELAILSSSDSTLGSAELAANLRAEFDLELLVVTLGADGAFLVTESKVIEAPPVKLTRLVDTVGAGDAFDSVVILGLICGWGLRSMLDRATEFSAAVCGIRGATDNSIYKMGWSC